MVTLHEVTDPADPRLADYRDLRDVELRKHLEAEHGLFLAEGEKVVRRAVEAGFMPRSFLMAPRWLEGLDDVLSTTDAPCFVVSEAAGRGGHRLPRPPRRAGLARAATPAVGGRRCSRDARSVLVLEDIVDHTNVGADLPERCRARRSTPCCWLPGARTRCTAGRSRSCMGAVFSMPWTRVDPTGTTGLAVTHRAGIHDGGADLGRGRDRAVEDACRWRRSGWPWCSVPRAHGRHAGCERSRRTVASGFPMAAGIDSLNVAAATAVACYATR